MKRALALVFAVALSACAAPAQQIGPNGDPFVPVTLTNSGAQPMRCMLMFGHWVERDLGVLAPGAGTAFTIQQARQDGALYVERADGQRRMMIENLFCAQPDNWRPTVGQADLAPARAARPQSIAVRCGVGADGKVSCAPLVLQP
jgi:hypothetical protein